MNKESYRIVMGERLKAFRESRGLSAYRVAKEGGIRIDQVRSVESGDCNYTIDVFLGYIAGSSLYMYFAEKDNPSDGHDFDELVEKAKSNRPKG